MIRLWALIIDDTVHEIIEADQVEGLFHPSLEFIDITSQEVIVGQFFDRAAGVFRDRRPAPWFSWDNKADRWVDTRPPAAVLADYTAAIQARLDAFAQSRGYDSGVSCASYAASTNATFKAEGQYCVTARDNTWAACYAIMAEVEAGKRSMPSLEEIMAELPKLAWPS